MKLGYIRMPEQHRHRALNALTKAQDHLAFADSLNFQLAYFPRLNPHHFAQSLRRPPKSVKIALDAAAFGPLSPSEIESAVRNVNETLDGKLNLGVELHGANAPAKDKAQAQAFETLFSYDPRVDQVFAASRYPMAPPCPEILGLPVTGSSEEAKCAAARGYLPLTPSWMPDTEVARFWPAIVAGATSAVRRAQPSHWHVARMVLVHDDPQSVTDYIYGSNSPFRRHFKRLSLLGLIGPDIDFHLKRVVIAGSAGEVAEKILALREAVGAFGTLHIVDPLGSDRTMTKNTMIRMTEEVLPMVHNPDTNTVKNLERT
ncbi:MAG: hypothetical protein ABJO27_23970 [Pseudoruegeria sp.]